MVAKKQIYEFFRPELRDASYEIGDVYSPDKVRQLQKEWEILPDDVKKPLPYLTHVKALSNTWPHLRLLADFMEVGTTPLRWKELTTTPPPQGPDLHPLECQERIKKRAERAARTNVMLLKYMASGNVEQKHCRNVSALHVALNDESTGGGERENEHEQRPDGEGEIRGDGRGRGGRCNLQLYVVEDLSRDVIEALGSKFDIEPAFFREHIVDYAWYNVRDRWEDPPSLQSAEEHRRWIQLRYVTARYYKTPQSFKAAIREASNFNVLRRPDDDLNNKAVWDSEDAIVGVMRTRTSFWLKKGQDGNSAVGILLLDPTIKEGTPLWHGYRNWSSTPSMHSPRIPAGPPRDSLFNDFIYWAKQPSASIGSVLTHHPTSVLSGSSKTDLHAPTRALLYLVCAEWLTMASYIRTRLGIIDWEISLPDNFAAQNIDTSSDGALSRLHVWRRLVPLYQEMLTDSIRQVFGFPCHDSEVTTVSINGVGSSSGCPCAQHASSASRFSSSIQPARPPGPEEGKGSIAAIRVDFARALSYMQEYQMRIDRVTSILTSTMSIEESRHAIADAKNVARLTWLASFFIPMSLIASLFSMQADVYALAHTMRLYFATALPVAAVAMGLAWVILKLKIWFSKRKRARLARTHKRR
ncbi:hypothetical protein MBM_01059 [Drepanopeziza brunnea f. sp. 'multigermtubi' MB_m1]|uniref:Uncharacterized protein n=1 Tax=Marssonina brunnea f. sp. multigermtubi (strain MB_m1) TaxID=1072389 RepID=K1X5I9_MARBU|nr:uncharacterized protein MBM_01059 [Drepanopeziza brunnea f. sp. 'multigermtubi' MB_m1]EKD20377.1 hypothetical protein MBM_01059 [Drepanopeziza brunnea f. sp. 'multigermtubi' MB_m1]